MSMADETDQALAGALIRAVERERLSLAAVLNRVDDEILRRSEPPPWLIDVSLAKSLPDVLRLLGHIAGGGAEGGMPAARARAVRVALDALAGDMSPILAARELASLRSSVKVDDDDPDFLRFVAIDSETDALPLGAVRRE